MKKRSPSLIILLFIFFSLGAITLLVIRNYRNSSLANYETSFAIKDTASIQKIVLNEVVKGKPKQKITLSRTAQNQWLLDGKYPVKIPRIKNFLSTINSIQVVGEVSAKSQPFIRSQLKGNYIEVEAYDYNKLIKKYYVGEPDNKQESNIMMMEGAENAYYVSLPGFHGYVSGRYNTNPFTWRAELLFHITPSELQKIELAYFDRKDSSTQSIRLTKKDGNNWYMNDLQPIDSAIMAQYLSFFNGRIYASGFASPKFPGLSDSLRPLIPDASLRYQLSSGKTNTVKLFSRPDNIDSYFGWTTAEGELYIIQRYVFDKFLKTVDYFSPSS